MTSIDEKFWLDSNKKLHSEQITKGTSELVLSVCSQSNVFFKKLLFFQKFQKPYQSFWVKTSEFDLLLKLSSNTKLSSNLVFWLVDLALVTSVNSKWTNDHFLSFSLYSSFSFTTDILNLLLWLDFAFLKTKSFRNFEFLQRKWTKLPNLSCLNHKESLNLKIAWEWPLAFKKTFASWGGLWLPKKPLPPE